MKPVNVILLLALTTCALAGCGDAPTPTTEAHDEAAADEGTELARIDAAAATSAGIEVAPAEPAKLRESVLLYGLVVPNAERTRNVSARYAGVVKSVAVVAGDSVKVGAVLATIESNDSLQAYAITAPIAGVVTARNVSAGESVAEQTLFTITDLSTVWVELSAFPRDLTQIRTGQLAQVKSADGALAGSGRIVFVSALGSTATQSTTVRLVLDNPERRWTPGLYVAADVVVQEIDVPIAVKSQALQSLAGERVVFVAVAGGFAPRPVRSGRSDAAITEILAGLAAGERYVSANSFIVKSELTKSTAGHDH